MPSYAVGTDYVPRDMVANIHKGEIIVPSMPSAIIRGLVRNNSNENDDRLVDAINALAAKVERLEASARETARHTANTEAHLRNSLGETGGIALAVKVIE